jgi:hypothetical protein
MIEWKEDYWGYEVRVDDLDLAVWYDAVFWCWRVRYTTFSGNVWKCEGKSISKTESKDAAIAAMRELLSVIKKGNEQ